MKKVLEMLPYLIKYYSCNWKEAFLKACTTHWLCLYFAVSWIMFLCGEMIEDGILNGLIYFGLFLPLILAGIHSVMFPNRLEKILFLCPLGYRERSLFLLLGYWFRLSCVGAVSILIIFLMLAAELLKPSIYLFGFFICEMIFAAVIFLMTYTEESRNNGNRSWMGVGGVVSIISCLVFGSAAIDYFDRGLVEDWEKVIIIILFSIQLLLFLQIIVNCWKKEMEIAADYEKNFLFLQKEKRK